MKKIPLFLLAGMTLLFSCSKSDNDDAPAPDPVQEAAAALQKNVQGKWVFNTDITVGRVAMPQHAKVARNLLGHTKPQQVQPNGPNGTNDVEITGFIEFTSDSTYYIYDENQQVYTGRFEAKTGDSIVLAGFGYLTGINIAGSNLTFKLYYSAASKTIAITTNKAPEVAANDRNTLFCQHPWYVTPEADGAELIGYEDWEYVNGEEVSFIVDSVTILMSKNGTYLVQNFSNGKLKFGEVANWKWHSTDANKFVYAWDDEPFDEANSSVLITELTATSLKISETWDRNGDGIDESSRIVLKPAIRK